MVDLFQHTDAIAANDLLNIAAKGEVSLLGFQLCGSYRDIHFIFRYVFKVVCCKFAICGKGLYVNMLLIL